MKKIDTMVLGNLVFNTPNAEATVEDMVKMLDENIGHWRKQNLIWDLKNFSFKKLSMSELEKYIDIAKDMLMFGDSNRTAFVAYDELSFKLLSMLSLKAKEKYQLDIDAFRSFEHARQWVDGLVRTA